MSCNNPLFVKNKFGDYKPVPCGCCIQCRIDRREMWTDRIRFECNKAYWSGSGCSFVALTYNDECVPRNLETGCFTLCKADVVGFVKRLNRRIHYHSEVARRDHILPDYKYFAVGEYGEEKGRSHIHFVFMGIPFESARPWIESCWSFGRPDVRDLTNGGIRYILSYIDKEQRDDDVNNVYRQNGVEPPFSLKSKGIGKDYLRDNASFIIRNNGYRHNDSIRPIPRYYQDLLGIDNSQPVKIPSQVRSYLLDQGGSLDLATLEVAYNNELNLVRALRNKNKPVDTKYLESMKKRLDYFKFKR